MDHYDELVEFFGDVALYERYMDFLSACRQVDPLPRRSGQHRKWYLLKRLSKWINTADSQLARLAEMNVMLRRGNAVRFISPAKILVRQRKGQIAEETSREEKWKVDYTSPLFTAPIYELAETTIATLDIPKWAIQYLCPYWGTLYCQTCEHPPISECSWECWKCKDKCGCWRCDRLCEVCLDKDRCQIF